MFIFFIYASLDYLSIEMKNRSFAVAYIFALDAEGRLGPSMLFVRKKRVIVVQNLTVISDAIKIPI